MKQGLTEIIFVIDKSGSMESKKEDVIGGFNSFIEEQRKEPGEAKVTVTLFDTVYEIIHNGVDLKDIPALSPGTYTPGGMTALLDAVGKTIYEVGARLAGTEEEERPERVLMVVMTDGMENSSKEYLHSQVKEMIKIQEGVYKWQFVFLGADITAVNAGQSLGIRSAHQGTATAKGVRCSFLDMSQAVSRYRKDGNWSYSGTKN